MKDEKEIFPLTGLRFVAAFYVFLFHIHIRWPISSHSFAKNVLDQGAIGMSLFFMLSGLPRHSMIRFKLRMTRSPPIPPCGSPNFSAQRPNIG
jgi:hypothetical protein